MIGVLVVMLECLVEMVLLIVVLCELEVKLGCWVMVLFFVEVGGLNFVILFSVVIELGLLLVDVDMMGCVFLNFEMILCML